MAHSLPASLPFSLAGDSTIPDVPDPIVIPDGELIEPFTRVEHLTRFQRRMFEDGLCATHERRITIDVLHLNGDHAGTLGLVAMDGQLVVTKPAADAVARTLTLNFVDTDRTLDFSPTSPGENVFFDRMIRVHDNRYIPSLGWVSTAIFTGPVQTFRRNGSEVELTAHGKERLAMQSQWSPTTLHKGMHKVAAIRKLLADTGETEFDFPNLPDRGNRLPEKKSLDRFGTPWAVAQKIARSMNRQLYYDGHGVCRLRKHPERTSFHFEGGDGGSVLSEPDVTRDLSDFHNVWLVLGKKPKGAKHRAHKVVRIPPSHPLSPESLGRSGSPRVLAEKIEDSSLRSQQECRRVGEQHMRDAIRGTVAASFEAVPIPHLTEGDLHVLSLSHSSVQFRLWEFTLPLAGASMSVGSVKRTPRRHGRRG